MKSLVKFCVYLVAGVATALLVQQYLEKPEETKEKVKEQVVTAIDKIDAAVQQGEAKAQESLAEDPDTTQLIQNVDEPVSTGDVVQKVKPQAESVQEVVTEPKPEEIDYDKQYDQVIDRLEGVITEEVKVVQAVEEVPHEELVQRQEALDARHNRLLDGLVE